jgi:hypothetical protein
LIDVEAAIAVNGNNERRITFFMLSIPKRRFAKIEEICPLTSGQ